jgi:hypothetical protein
LAGSECCANQAFRLGDNVYGLQFHFELTPAMIRSWMRDRGFRDEAKSNGHDPDAIAHAAEAECEKIRPVAEGFFGAFFKRAHARMTTAA